MIKTQVGHVSGIRIAIASIVDGLIGLITFGSYLGDFRQRASLSAARRQMMRDDPQTFLHE